MGKFDGTLLLCDMDGTLLNSQKQITDKNLSAIRYFTDNGGLFSLATGRTVHSASKYFKELPINAPISVFNGSVVYDIHNQKPIWEMFLDDKGKKLTYEVMEKFKDVGIEVSTSLRTHLCRGSEISKRHFAMVGFDYILEDINDIKAPWIKLNFTAEHERLLDVAIYLEERAPDEYFIVFSAPYFLEMMDKNANKGLSALKIADYCGIDRDRLYTIGDNYNDIEMLECAKISFAPENAEDDVKNTASVVVSNNNSDSIADVVGYLDDIYQ